MSEAQIVHAYEPEGLGYTWVAMAPLLRSDHDDIRASASDGPTRERPQRELTGFVSSQGLQFGSSPTDRPDTASSAPSRLGYVERSSAPLVEDFTIRFLSCLIRCVLNHAQPLNKTSPFVQYRDERLMYRTKQSEDRSKEFGAIDDGGVQVKYLDNSFQVAILEAVDEGVSTISDELLAQVVGEALALRLSGTSTVHREEVIAIIAVRYYVKILHLRITDVFLRRFEALSPNERSKDRTTFLPIKSTH
ncbi:hypothetical protein ED733_007493 [Metarhizium rileyi]|uniref:Uncharacterized protein n=1 Tax=Metarhizium rileyi (strain RCEF 4871) TaxID=1649241 RepID=A0A5C6GJQ0_METRR|nr:hypothetical protein ED733_007493 [Metarhizium rileyi]